MLTSRQNPLIKQIRKLHHSRGRKKQQLLLLEGTHLVQEACATRYPLEVVCATPTWQAQHPQLWQVVMGRAQRSELVSDEVLGAIATTSQPDGVIATAPRTRDSLRPTPALTLGLVLETIQDPGNLGTMIRTAAAAGADGLWLSPDTVDIDHPKVLRASAGQWFRLPLQVAPDLPTELRAHQAAGMQVIATHPQAERPYWAVDLCQPTMILLGNEGAGLSPQLSALADRQVSIPLAPGVESLNVAIAAALILYEAQRQRRQSPLNLECNNIPPSSH